LRIIAGKYKSRKVHSGSPESKADCLKGRLSGYRPTTDRARETLFNTLNNILDFDSVTCLDLFAGSGALGFEALSRGAASCDFVETSVKQTEYIRHTAEDLKCTENIKILKQDAISFLKRNPDAEYDLIMADPPYGYEFYNELNAEIIKHKFGIFVLEYGAEGAGLYDPSKYDVINKKAGITNFKLLVSKD
jgi:16S rRNA (guanine966-N2)-methyltransferase